MPRLWNETIETHRRDVREAIFETTLQLVNERGLLSVTMSEIAERAGIGRATLYKYFPDVEAILHAWHKRRIANHLAHLAEVADRASAERRLKAVLEAYALASGSSHGHDLAAILHHDDQVGPARHLVRDMLRVLIEEGVKAGRVRSDVPPDELAAYCVSALTAPGTHRSDAAVRRLVQVVLSGLSAGP